MHMPDPVPWARRAPTSAGACAGPGSEAAIAFGSRSGRHRCGPAAGVAAANWLTTDNALAQRRAARSWPAGLFAFGPRHHWCRDLDHRASRPSTSELYIVTYHSSEARLPLRGGPGRVSGP